jgi:hypothetical protein
MKLTIKITFLFVAMVMSVSIVNGQKMTAETVIAKHLDSIASAEKRSAVTSFIAVGDAKVEFISPKEQPAAGRIVMASQDGKLFYGMMFSSPTYPHEKIIYDGNKTFVAVVNAGNRSVFGNFLQSSSGIVSHGVFGGVLSNSWFLNSTPEARGKLRYEGTKKIGGKEVHSVSYQPKGGSDVEMTLFFDAATFNHVRSEYKRTNSAGIGRTIDESARQSESRLRLVEDFSDFKQFEGITLPHKYKLHYTVTSGRGTTDIVWTFDLNEFAINQKLDPSTFDPTK